MSLAINPLMRVEHRNLSLDETGRDYQSICPACHLFAVANAINEEAWITVHMTAISAKCLACYADLPGATLGEYARCSNCGSYRYLSRNSAEQDNMAYFNQREVWEVPQDSVKQQLALVAERAERVLLFASWFRLWALERRLKHHCLQADSVLEIGFGDGYQLARLLKAGANAYGIDLSRTAVERFRAAHPQHADRVQTGARPEGSFEVIYANALLEHLDEPDIFLDNAANALAPDGILALGLPVLSASPANITREIDINFWKPCHRAIYSYEGMEELLQRHGYHVEVKATVDKFPYRVMNVFLGRGFSWIHEYRTPEAELPEAPSRLDYVKILLHAMRVRSLSHWGLVFARRI